MDAVPSGTYTVHDPIHPVKTPPTPHQFTGMAQEPSPAPAWSHAASEQPSRVQDTSLAPRAFFSSETTDNSLDPPGEAWASESLHHSPKGATKGQRMEERALLRTSNKWLI